MSSIPASIQMGEYVPRLNFVIDLFYADAGDRKDRLTNEAVSSEYSSWPEHRKLTSRPNVELQSNAVDLQRLCLTVGGVHVASHQRSK